MIAIKDLYFFPGQCLAIYNSDMAYQISDDDPQPPGAWKEWWTTSPAARDAMATMDATPSEPFWPTYGLESSQDFYPLSDNYL